MTVIFLYIFVMVPYITCFYRIGKSGGAERWNIIYPTYAVCIVDIFLNFFTGFVSSDEYDIILDVTLIIRYNCAMITNLLLKGLIFNLFIVRNETKNHKSDIKKI